MSLAVESLMRPTWHLHMLIEESVFLIFGRHSASNKTRTPPLIESILRRFEGWSITVSGPKEDAETAKGEKSKLQRPQLVVQRCHSLGSAVSVNQLQGVPTACGLGWVDLDFECSTVCPIGPGLMGMWQKRLGS